MTHSLGDDSDRAHEPERFYATILEINSPHRSTACRMTVASGTSRYVGANILAFRAGAIA
jgi:hypothetical protein